MGGEPPMKEAKWWVSLAEQESEPRYTNRLAGLTGGWEQRGSMWSWTRASNQHSPFLQTTQANRQMVPASTLEAEILEAISEARADPKACEARIEARLQHFKGKDYFPPNRGGKTVVPTKEGTAAVMDAVSFLANVVQPGPFRLAI